MTSAFATPLIVHPDQTSIGLERVALSGGNSTEAYSEATGSRTCCTGIPSAAGHGDR